MRDNTYLEQDVYLLMQSLLIDIFKISVEINIY